MWMLKKAYIFDMDGVIYDSEPIHAKAKKQVLASYGISITDERLATFVGRSSRDFYSVMVEENPQCKATWQQLADEKHRLYKNMLAEDGDIKAIDGVKELLERLTQKGYLIGLGSSSTREMIDVVLNRFGLREYFKVTISGGDLPRSKPDPLIFLTVADKLGVAPENCTVIEDATSGIKAAKAAGMYCIAYKNPNSGPQDLSQADRIVSSHYEIQQD